MSVSMQLIRCKEKESGGEGNRTRKGVKDGVCVCVCVRERVHSR